MGKGGGEPPIRGDVLGAGGDPKKQVNARTLDTLLERIPESQRVAGDWIPGEKFSPVAATEFRDLDLERKGKAANITAETIQRIWRDSIRDADTESNGTRGDLAQSVVDRLRMNPGTPEFWNSALTLADRARYWYEVSAEAMRDLMPDLTPQQLRLFISILAATSPVSNPYQNMHRAVAAMSNLMRGLPIDSDLVIPEAVREAIQTGGSLSGLKTGSFGGTMQFVLGLTRTPSLSTNDRQVASTFSIDGSELGKNPILYEVLSRFYMGLRDELNANLSLGEQPYETWQLQALGWVAQRYLGDQKEANDVDDYLMALTRQSESTDQTRQSVYELLTRAGIDVPGAVLTNKVLTDPRLVEALSPTTTAFRAARVVTGEINTLRTELGRSAQDLYNRAVLVDDKKAIKDYQTLYPKLLYRASRGENNPFNPLLSAITGKTTKVSRVSVPTGRRPFSVGGSYEGRVSPNIRVPIDAEVSEADAEFMLSVLAKQWDQDAVAAGQFLATSGGAAVRSGYTRTYQLFLETQQDFTDSSMAAFLAELPEGVNVGYDSVPNGFVINLFPAFGSDGDFLAPAYGAIEAAAQKLSSFGNIAISPVDFKSGGYGEIGSYDRLKDAWRKRVLDELAAELKGKVRFLKGVNDGRGLEVSEIVARIGGGREEATVSLPKDSRERIESARKKLEGRDGLLAEGERVARDLVDNPKYGRDAKLREFIENNSRRIEGKEPKPPRGIESARSGRRELRPEQPGVGGGSAEGRSLAYLEGAPLDAGTRGPIPDIVDTAERYARDNGIQLRRQAEYVEVDPALGKRISEVYSEMKHEPDDPRVQASYAALIRETRGQYDALVSAGYSFSFFDQASDPYGGNPWLAMRELRSRKRLAVYGTYDGYGNSVTGFEADKNLLVVPTGLRWPDQAGVLHDVTANDLFRAVHDAFGHGMEGAGFRARGEANAFEAHARLFTPAAMMALTNETRAQNSWLNFGPYGEANRNAKVGDTVFSDQKNGVLPEWTWTEGRAGDQPPSGPNDNLPIRRGGMASSVSRPVPPPAGRGSSASLFVDKLIEDNRVPPYGSREKLIDMNIDDFLMLAEKGFSSSKYDDVNKLMDEGEKFYSLPFLNAYADGKDFLKIRGHEGRHRARALKEAGYQTMPVILRTDIRWSFQNDPSKRYDYAVNWPTRIESEDSNRSIPMPVSREQSMAPYGGVAPDGYGSAAETQRADAEEFERLPVVRGGMASSASRPVPPPGQPAPQPAPNAPAGPLLGDESFKDLMQRKFEDFLLRGKRLEEAISSRIGRPLADDESAYVSAILMGSKVAAQMEDYRKKYWMPLAESLSREGLTQAELDKFLIARHAKERNAFLLGRGGRADGAGISDAQAKADLQSLAPKLAKLNRSAKIVSDMLAETMDRTLAAGLIDQATFDLLRNRWKFYVPLKGSIDEDLADIPFGSSGRGFGISGPEFERAEGRYTKASGPSTYAMSDGFEKLIRIEKNEVGKALIKLAGTTPTGGLITVTDFRRDSSLRVRVDGKDKYVRFSDDLLSRAYKNLGAGELNQVVAFLSDTVGRLNRFLSRSYTSYNPEWAITNTIRDSVTGLVTAGDVAELEGIDPKDFVGLVSGNIPSSMRALSLIAFEKNSNNPETQEMMRFAEEFRQAGGKTGWLKRGTMEELRAEIREVTGEVSASSTYKDTMVGLLKTAGKYSGVSPYMSFMDKLADVSDNGVRLATFAELRRKGVPVKRAAYHAKELTVNFSKTGELGPALNQAFLFFNTAVVGNARFARAVLRSPYVRAAAGAFAAAGVTAGMISMAMSGDDEDGEDRWMKIPDYEKERYAILMYGPETTDVIKIPLPWSFAFTYTAGTYLTEFFAGKRDASDTVFGIVRAAVSNFSPFQLGNYDGPVTQGILAATPTLLKPGIENLMNENFMGSPITPRRFPGDFTPNSEVAMRKTAPAYREVAEALNDVTGGERGVSGALDLYPDHIRHTFEFLIGGTGKFVTRSVGTAMDVAAGEELDASRIPFVRQFGGVATVGDSQIYYDRVEEVMQRGDVALEYARSSGSEAEYRKENRNWIDLAKKAKETESRLRTFRQQRKVAEGSTRADRKEKIKEAEDKMDAAFIEFNRSYNAVMRQ